MKMLLLILLPVMSFAQSWAPRFENDTLYTSCGYKIYKGITIHLAKGTGRNGNFRFIKIDREHGILHNTSILVKEVKDFKISGLGNSYIRIVGTITYVDGSKGGIDFSIAFDKAIENFPGLPAELIVPDEYRNKSKGTVADELIKLKKLLDDHAITQDEYDKQKTKLLNQ